MYYYLNMTVFNTASILKGVITPQDLLMSQGTFKFWTQGKDSTGFIFEFINEEFCFTFGMQNQSFVIQRNETVSVLTLEEFNENKPMMVIVMWGFDSLWLICMQDDIKKEAVVGTTPCSPPVSLIRWAKKNNLLPIEEYDNEEQLRNKVCSCLQSIQDKINEAGSFNSFWNLHKDKLQTPKKEIDVHQFLHCLLMDQMFISTIEVIPEHKTGIGNIDFSFIGKIKNNGFATICLEFKNAHSEDLKNGLVKQLPLYMKNKNAKYGFYCVLDYRGDWFDKPKIKNGQRIDMMLSNLANSTKDPIQRNIRILIFDLSKQKTASS